MKRNSLILTVLAAAALVATGCSKQEGNAPTPPTTAPAASVDTSKLTAAFAAAEPALKSAADTAVTAIKKADYSGALTQLQALAGKTLTADQQTAVKDAIAAVQKAIAGAASKTAGNASKAASDAAGALPK